MPGPFDFIGKNGYDQGFCECFKDPACCLCACFLPCCMVGSVQGQIDDAHFNIWSCCCMPVSIYRIRKYVRYTYGIGESEDGAMCGSVCCPCCAIVQDAHELKHRKRIGGLFGKKKEEVKEEEPAAQAEPQKV